jgi:hypothetical protein
MKNKLKRLFMASTTIDSDLIDQAILMSSLSKEPVHISGQWFAWGELVLTKQAVLGVILSMAHGHGSTSSNARIFMDYVKTKHEIPAKYRNAFIDDIAANTDAEKLSYLKESVMKQLQINSGNLIKTEYKKRLLIDLYGKVHEEDITGNV